MSCNGRTFNAQKNLKAHLKVHEQREADKELYGDSDADDESESSNTTTKRRRGGETGRDWVCEVESCGKDFKSVRRQKHGCRLSLCSEFPFAEEGIEDAPPRCSSQ